MSTFQGWVQQGGHMDQAHTHGAHQLARAPWRSAPWWAGGVNIEFRAM